MSRMLSAVLFCLCVLPLAGCTPDANELINELIQGFQNGLPYDDEAEEYNCLSGNASLPSGSHPAWAVSPEGYHFNCGSRGKIRFLHGGVYTALTGSEVHDSYAEYWEQCRQGTRPPNIQGRWVIYQDTALCLWEDIVPGTFFCSEDIEVHQNDFGQVIGFTLDGYVTVFDEDNAEIDTYYDYAVCRLTED